MLKIVTTLILVSLALPVPAQEAPQGQHGHGEGCKAKIAALCPGVQPGNGRIRDCLKQQGKTLADVCPKEAAERQEKHQQSSGTTSPAPVANGAPGGFPTQAPTAQNPGSDDQ